MRRRPLYRTLRSLPTNASEAAKQQRRDFARKDEGDISKMTPEEAVLLLHVME
jgi:hypothetical protein